MLENYEHIPRQRDCKRLEILTTSRSEIYSATFTYGAEQCYLKKKKVPWRIASQNLVGDGSVTYTDASDEVPGRRSACPSEKELRERCSVTKYRWYLVKQVVSAVKTDDTDHTKWHSSAWNYWCSLRGAGDNKWTLRSDEWACSNKHRQQQTQTFSAFLENRKLWETASKLYGQTVCVSQACPMRSSETYHQTCWDFKFWILKWHLWTLPAITR
jgi:hypothetical protein